MNNSKPGQKLDDLFDYLAEEEFDGKRWPTPFLWVWAWLSRLRYLFFMRCVCAVKGCDVSYSRSGYLPEDCTEWACKRCNAEGINHVVYGVDRFDNDEPIRNLWMALRGK